MMECLLGKNEKSARIVEGVRLEQNLYIFPRIEIWTRLSSLTAPSLHIT
jgi:hypothetical protein